MDRDKRESEFETLLERSAERLVELAREGKLRIDALRAEAEANPGDPRFRNVLWGDRSYKGELGPGGKPCPAAPYKFVRFPERHVARCRQMFEQLAPREGSSVFEIGAGCGYLLYFCREVRHCEVTGIDVHLDRHLVYKVMKELQGLDQAVFEHRVRGHEPIPFGGSHDYVVSTWTTFNKPWDVEAHRFFLRDCREHLRPGGRVFLRFNLEGYKDRPDVEAFYRSSATFPVPDDDCLAVLEADALENL